ncbi:hypothetical protein UL79_12385, partial [Shigella dysenteriae]
MASVNIHCPRCQS